MSPSLLSKRLVQLQDAGVIERREVDGAAEYHPTEAGLALKPIIVALGFWGHRYVQHTIHPDDLDPALLMWDVRRGVDKHALPTRRRTVIHFDLAEVEDGKGRWWLVFDRGDVDLCLTNPGYDIDLTVRASLRTLCEVWIGHRDVQEALRSGAVRLDGASPLVLGFADWFALSRFAKDPVAVQTV